MIGQPNVAMLLSKLFRGMDTHLLLAKHLLHARLPSCLSTNMPGDMKHCSFMCTSHAEPLNIYNSHSTEVCVLHNSTLATTSPVTFSVSLVAKTQVSSAPLDAALQDLRRLGKGAQKLPAAKGPGGTILTLSRPQHCHTLHAFRTASLHNNTAQPCLGSTAQHSVTAQCHCNHTARPQLHSTTQHSSASLGAALQDPLVAGLVLLAGLLALAVEAPWGAAGPASRCASTHGVVH
jgi:hypothetical protein